MRLLLLGILCIVNVKSREILAAQSEGEGALVKLYESTGGTNWVNKTGWLSSSNHCTWYGITCESGKVTAIKLHANNLVGTIASIDFPPTISILRLDNNQIAGTIPMSLWNLRNMQQLRLDHNQFTGALPRTNQLGMRPQKSCIALFPDKCGAQCPVQAALSSGMILGTCPSTLPSGKHCLPECDDGFEPLGDSIEMSCDLGSMVTTGSCVSGGGGSMKGETGSRCSSAKRRSVKGKTVSRCESANRRDSAPPHLVFATAGCSCNLQYGVQTGVQQARRNLQYDEKCQNEQYKTKWQFSPQCHNLKTLRLDNNRFSGGIPETFEFPSVEAMSLAWNWLSGDAIGALTTISGEQSNTLMFLNLADNALWGQTPNFPSLKLESPFCWSTHTKGALTSPELQELFCADDTSSCLECNGVSVQPVAHENNIVSYNGSDWMTLDKVDPMDSDRSGCQTTAIETPKGWRLAPDDPITQNVVAHFPWGTQALILESGSSYRTRGTDSPPCPYNPSNPLANGGVCGPGASSDAGVGVGHFSAQLFSTELWPEKHKVEKCSRRILVTRKRKNLGNIPTLHACGGEYIGQVRCADSSAQNLPVLTLSTHPVTSHLSIKSNGKGEGQCWAVEADTLVEIDPETGASTVKFKRFTYNPYTLPPFDLTDLEIQQDGQSFNGKLSFSDPQKEYPQNCTVTNVKNHVDTAVDTSDLPDNYEFPTAVPILDQGLGGTCFAFAAASAITDRFHKTSPNYLGDAMVSPQFFVDFVSFWVGKDSDINKIDKYEDGDFEPNFGGCRGGGFAVSMFMYMEQYGAATCAGNCSGGCAPYTPCDTDDDVPAKKKPAALPSCSKQNDTTTKKSSRRAHVHKHTLDNQIRNIDSHAGDGPQARMSCSRFKRKSGNDQCNDSQCATVVPGSSNCITITNMDDCNTAAIVERIQREIFVNGSVVARIMVDEELHAWGAGGIHQHDVYVGGHEGVGGHEVKMTGWGVQTDPKTNMTQKYWKVANSWGKEWNGDGFFKVLRGENVLGIESQICFATPLLPSGGTTTATAGDGAPTPSPVPPSIGTLLQRAQVKNRLQKLSTAGAGDWLERNVSSPAVHNAAEAWMEAAFDSRRASPNSGTFSVTSAHSKVVNGAFIKLEMDTTSPSGYGLQVSTLVHRDASGMHTFKWSTIDLDEESKAAYLAASNEVNTEDGTELNWLWYSLGGLGMLGVALAIIVRSKQLAAAGKEESVEQLDMRKHQHSVATVDMLDAVPSEPSGISDHDHDHADDKTDGLQGVAGSSKHEIRSRSTSQQGGVVLLD